MIAIETRTSSQNAVSKEQGLESREACQERKEEFRRHRDELSRLLLSDYVDNALAQFIAVM